MVCTTAQPRMTLTTPSPVIRARAMPVALSALSKMNPMPMRLTTAAVTAMRSSDARDSSWRRAMARVRWLSALSTAPHAKPRNVMYLIARCRAHKERNVCDYLPEAERPWVRRKLRAAWANPEHREAKAGLEALARHLDDRYPDAAGSLRE